MDREILLKLIQEDDDGLLDVRLQLSEVKTSELRLIASFQEINEFIREIGREPQANTQDMKELRLYLRLCHLRKNREKIDALKEHDVFEVLERKAITSINDIYDDDDMGLFKDCSDSIFDIQHIPKETITPDYVAQRKQCHNFAKYESLFQECHADLAAGKRKLMPFAKEQHIAEGDFFVLKGILTYVDRVGEKEITNGKKNARLQCIFENGTESDMLLRSLARELYKNGRRVTIHDHFLLDELKGVTGEDRETGWIYILKSLSQKREIQLIDHLYKIGFSSIPIQERIKNAAQEPTYLMDSVSLIASYKCFNRSPQRFESLLHRFFAAACLDVCVIDRNGQKHTPREWFAVPIHIINQAIELLKSGEIVNYQYDHILKEIVDKSKDVFELLSTTDKKFL